MGRISILLSLFIVLLLFYDTSSAKNDIETKKPELRTPVLSFLSQSVNVPSFTETSLFDFNNKVGPEYIDDGLHGSKALLLTNLDVNISLSSALRVHENSISFWFKPDPVPKSLASLNNLESKALLTGGGFSLQTKNESELCLSRQITTTTKSSYDNHFEILQNCRPIGEEGVWHQIGVTLSRNDIKLYVDGMVVVWLNNPYITNRNTNQYIYLGKQTLMLEDGIEKEYLPAIGVVDNIRIFQGQLTDNQMYPLYAGEIDKAYAPQPIARSLPSTGINNLPFKGLSFEWFPHPLINKFTEHSLFTIQVATDSSFQGLVVEASTPDTLLNIPDLVPNTTYYWRVILQDEEQEGESPVWEIKTKLQEKNLDILTVMEFNVLGISPSGTDVAHVHGSEYAAEIIRNFTTDLVSLPEGGKMCETVASILDFHYLKDEDSNSRYAPCLLSRYPIVGQSFPPYCGSDKKISSHIQLADGEIIEFTVLHPRATDSGEVLTMLDISNEEAIDREYKARGNVIEEVLEILNNQKDIKNMILAGDLNSVSVNVRYVLDIR